MKRIENAIVTARVHQEVPSYFIECLAYNCPDSLFGADTWTEVVRNMLVHIGTELDGNDPDDVERRWVEVNECFYLSTTRRSGSVPTGARLRALRGRIGGTRKRFRLYVKWLPRSTCWSLE